uniref:Uncharacterized protein n=1 Tax=Rhizophora mucronata TaxID=61149 RepID=A0A2P2NGJ5_RHIMU
MLSCSVSTQLQELKNRKQIKQTQYSALHKLQKTNSTSKQRGFFCFFRNPYVVLKSVFQWLWQARQFSLL